MAFPPGIPRIFRFPWRTRTQIARDVNDELRFHLDMQIEELVARGMTRRAARREALRQFGDLDDTKRYCRTVDGAAEKRARRAMYLDELRQDLRYAVRGFITHPGLTAVTVLTIAIGIGTTVAIYAVVYGVLLRPLYYTDPDALVLFYVERDVAGRRTTTSMSLSPQDVEAIRVNAHEFESIAAFSMVPYALSVGESSVRVRGVVVSDRFFATMAGPFALGRPLGPGDDRRPVAVISYGLWHQRYGGSAAVVGREVVLNSLPYEIVGVAGDGLRFPDASFHRFGGDTDVWTPMGFALQTLRELQPRRSGPSAAFDIVARLKAGRTHRDAAAELTRIVRGFSATEPFSQYREVRAVELDRQLVAVARPALWLLFGAAVLFLAAAEANVVSLSVARGAARAREHAVRLALGATPRRLLMESLARSGLLTVMGSAIGVAFAVGSTTALRTQNPAGLPHLDAIRIDEPVMCFAIVLAAATTVVAGVLPTRLSGHTARLTNGGMPSAGRPTTSLRRILVVGQIATSCVLLVGSALFVRSLMNLLDSDLGIVTDGAVAASLDLSLGRTLTGEQQNELVERVLARIQGVPGVEAVGAATVLPPTGSTVRALYRHPDETTGQMTEYLLDMVPTTPGFFAALGVSVVDGRIFSAADVGSTPGVAILNADMARRLFGDRIAVGRTLSIPPDGVTIVGVVNNISNRGVGLPPDNTLYVPFAQSPRGDIDIVARTSGDVSLAASALRGAIGSVDPGLAIATIRPLDDVLRQFTDPPRLRAGVLSGLAGMGLVLAAVSLYGLLAFVVSRRMPEFGIRMAIGATPSDLRRLVLQEGLWLTLIGVSVGLAASAALARLAGRLLYGVGANDPASFVAAGAILSVVAVLASYIPAARASRADPLIALKTE